MDIEREWQNKLAMVGEQGVSLNIRTAYVGAVLDKIERVKRQNAIPTQRQTLIQRNEETEKADVEQGQHNSDSESILDRIVHSSLKQNYNTLDVMFYDDLIGGV